MVRVVEWWLCVVVPNVLAARGLPLVILLALLLLLERVRHDILDLAHEVDGARVGTELGNELAESEALVEAPVRRGGTEPVRTSLIKGWLNLERWCFRLRRRRAFIRAGSRDGHFRLVR